MACYQQLSWNLAARTGVETSVRPTTLQRLLLGVVSASLISVVACAHRVPMPLTLSPAELRLSKLQASPPPRQHGTISCESGPTTYTRSGDVYIPDVPEEECFPKGDFFVTARVSARQYVAQSRFPIIVYEIDKSGRVRSVGTLVSSGIQDVDAIAMNAARSRTFKMSRHCVSCRIETEVQLDF